MKKVFKEKKSWTFIIVTLLLSNWFLQILNRAPLVSVLGFLTVIVLVTYFFRPNKKFEYILVLLILIISTIQIKTIKLSEVYKESAVEIDLQLKRYNYYPPRFFRLGHILEIKKPVQIFYKVQKNYFEAVDLGLYFPTYFSYFSIPLIVYGAYLYFKRGNIFLATLFFTALLLTTVVGTHGDFGPIVIYPFLTTNIFISLIKIFKVKV